MRLRKNMKRTAAAVLALSMAVSAVAAPASAAYICDVSQGNVEISVDADGNKSIKVGDDSVTIKTDGTKETTGNGIKEDGDGTEDIVITGDNTKSTESQNAEEENTSEVEKSGENASEVEKSGETKTEGKDKTQNSAAEGEDEGDEPTSQELLTPEDEEKKDEEKKDEQKPAETQETEQDKKTEKTSDQVIEYDQYDPEAQQEAAKPAPKPAAEQKAEEKKAAEEKTYEATNAPTTLSESVQAAANNVVSIINNFTTPLKVILRDLKVDAGDTDKSAVTVSGTGDVTLELDGKNELKGGTGRRYPSVYRGSGLDNMDQKGTLTITDEDKNGSLTAVGGDHVGVVSDSRYGGNGIYARNLTISGATVTAVGGGADDRGSSNVHQNGSVGGDGINANGSVKFSNATVTATGGSTFSDKTRVQGGIGLEITSSGEFIIDSGTNLTVTGGSAESETGRVQGGQGLYLSGSRKKMTVNGATLTLAGGNAKTNSTDSSSAAGAGMQGRPATDTEITNSKVTVIGGDLTGGRTKKANAVTINVALNNNFKLDGDTTFTSSGSIHNISSGKITVAGDATLVQEDNSYNKNTKIELEENGKIYILGDVTVTENEDGTKTISGTPTGKKVVGHDYKVVSIVEATCTTPGKITYRCETADHSDTDEDVLAPLGHDFVDGVCTRCGAPEQAAVESNGGSSAVVLTVTPAVAYETSIADGRYIIAVPAETAVLSGCLGNLKELKAQGADTIVFRTQLRETALNIDSMLSLGVDDTLFTLTHSGESAELTVGGFAHNELLH
jgi:hypothetical protein